MFHYFIFPLSKQSLCRKDDCALEIEFLAVLVESRRLDLLALGWSSTGIGFAPMAAITIADLPIPMSEHIQPLDMS
jgi:hypothetical protein